MIDGDGAAAEQDIQPQRRRERAVRRRILRRARDGVAQQPDGLVVVQVIGEVRRALELLYGRLRFYPRR